MAGKAKRQRIILVGGGITVALGLVVALGYLISELVGEEAPQTKKVVHQIQLLKPPPPPEKPEVKPPEQKVEKEVDIPEPEQMPEQMPDMPDMPPMDQLGLDAEGGAGDAFGLVGRKGGRGLLEGDPLAWYAGLTQQSIYEALANNEAVRKQRYTAVVKLWIDDQGRIRRAELTRFQGAPEVAEAIRKTLNGQLQIAGRPPEGMPQPIRVRIRSHS